MIDRTSIVRTSTVNVLVASHLYPGPLSQIYGSFVHNQVRFLQTHCDLRVVAPTPWFPLPGWGRWSAYGDVPAQELRDGVEVLRPRYVTLPRRILLGRAWRSYLAALVRSTPVIPDVIHAHCAYPDGRAAVEYGRRIDRPVVITVHGHDIKDLAQKRTSWRRLVVEALDGAALVIAVSQDLRQRILDLGIPAAKVEVIPNGVDGALFQGSRKRHPGEDGWRLLYVGRLEEAKGVGVLLSALARLRQHRTDWRLTLIGGNPFTGDAQTFRRQSAELGLEDCVEFLDEVSWTEVPAHMQEADVFLLPSFSEGLPLAMLEAMASGLPVISTRCGGPEEAIDPETGLLVEVADVAGLEAAIETMLDGYSRYDRERIHTRTVERYDYRRVAERIYKLYDRLA